MSNVELDDELLDSVSGCRLRPVRREDEACAHGPAACQKAGGGQGRAQGQSDWQAAGAPAPG